MSKKSQISIFILIAVFILFLLIFLIFSNFSDKNNQIDKDKVKINSVGDDRINFVKERVDHCIDRSLKRATITSGLRGGFIYNEGEYYFGGVIPHDTYTKKLFSNLDLNWNNLQSRVLVHSQVEIYSPPIDDSTNSIYSHTIKEDFERFITYEFLKCLNFEDVEELYDFEYNDFTGNVLWFDLVEGIIFIENFDAEIGDELELDYFEGFISGEVVSETEFYFIAHFDDISVLNNVDPQSLSNMSVINLNNKFEVNVTFNIEDISAEVFYPIGVSNKDFSTSYENSKVTLNVRYGAIINEFSKKILNYKYDLNKSINYLNGENIVEVLSSSDYFRNLFANVGVENSGFEFRSRYILDEEEHKQYVYSIIDYNSMILGRPFVFNFAYENVAPYIEFTNLDLGFDVDYSEDAIVMIASANVPITYNLWDESYDEQIVDNWKFYFVEQHIHRSDADFDLTPEGMLTFLPKREKLYTYEIQITDGDAIRTYNLVFITGFPDNTNNQEFVECIDFNNFGHSLFPIEGPFDNVFIDLSTDYNSVFGYQLYVDPSLGIDIQPSILTLKRFCSVPISNFPVRIEIFEGVNLIDTYTQTFESAGDLDFEIPISDKVQRVEITVENSAESSMIEPFVIEIYPAQCLGPHPLEIDGINGDLSCCNVLDVLDSINDGNPVPYLDNVLDGEVVLDDELYLKFDYSSDDFDYSNEILWNVFGSDISSLYITQIVAQCSGVYPVFYKNLNPFVGNDLQKNLDAVEVNINGNYILGEPNVDVLRATYVEQQDDICEFGYIDNISGIKFFIEGDLAFNTGFVNMNSDSGDVGIFPIPDGTEFSDIYVLCDDTTLVGNQISGWSTGDFGFGRGKIYVSKSYCSQDVVGSSSCLPKLQTVSPTIYGSDLSAQCSDLFYDYSLGVFDTQDNDDMCGVGETCISGICVVS
ncbi:MAG: hypothetical protein PF569_09580 [Candidatus Woesearchaeota archaeon]|jgi:hypothetical protein|nr:hypothetical protein [Candidatus Woesearchaeota archaeon]